MIRAENIHKAYGSLEVLGGISLEIKKAEIVSVVGASGAGKSTLLHILGTLDKADQGTVSINGQAIANMNEKKLSAFRNKEIGFVFQFHHLLPEFTALENICIPAYIAGDSKKEAIEKAQKLINLLGLSARMDHKPAALSGGEQQRVAVARALVNNPAVVIADEPSGNLDSNNSVELHKLFLSLRNELEQTFVIVTHNKELAEMADRQMRIKDGIISQHE
ncbi:MAG: lipoprotein-releasing system ATP-binding protein LolD [Bacteroidetes bacterium]|nr:MAG: lipoprotein-releasing system ATP-binding protein LolD [Bacteroidota bacterium]